MSKYRERKPTSKGLLVRVKCQQRNARTRAILSVFPKPRESASLQTSCYVAGSITSQSFPDSLNLAESCREKAVFVQRHNTSLHSKFRQTALKLTPKGLDYTQIDTLWQPCVTDLWFWEVLGQSQSWLRTMQTDFCESSVSILASLNSWPPVENSNSCACVKTWLCSFKLSCPGREFWNHSCMSTAELGK